MINGCCDNPTVNSFLKGSVSKLDHFQESLTIINHTLNVEIVESKMREDDITTAYQLHALLLLHSCNISKRTVLCCHSQLGWTFRGSAYCQLIRHTNKVKRLEWAREHLNDSFDNVVWTDECLVQLESHKRFCC